MKTREPGGWRLRRGAMIGADSRGSTGILTDGPPPFTRVDLVNKRPKLLTPRADVAVAPHKRLSIAVAAAAHAGASQNAASCGA
jgi:hypothetical protein